MYNERSTVTPHASEYVTYNSVVRIASKRKTAKPQHQLNKVLRCKGNTMILFNIIKTENLPAEQISRGQTVATVHYGQRKEMLAKYQRSDSTYKYWAIPTFLSPKTYFAYERIRLNTERMKNRKKDYIIMSASDNVMLGYAKIDNAGKIVAASLFEKWEKKNLHRERVTPLIGVTKAHALLHLCAKLDISLVPKV